MLPEFVDTPGLRTVDSPIRIAGEEKRKPMMAPDIGQHTKAILQECGLSEAQIQQLMKNGAAA
jgi:crotonobetainyl-CoA:carnitine CoA-transferase CaiB-like acyl-CoA transferase